MKSKIIGVIIGVIILGTLIISGLSQTTEAPVLTATSTATSTASTTAATTTQKSNQTPSQSAPAPEKKPVTAAPAPTPAPQPSTKTTTFTSTEIALHNNRSSCYTIIRNNVYDLTAWIDEHPGGEREILSICGKDGTRAFEGQHGGDSKPEKILASFFIGIIAQ